MAQAVYLFSSCTSDAIQEQNQRRLEDALEANKIDYIKIDGFSPDQKDLRNNLFTVSSQRGKYPQLFIKENDNYTFVGLWDTIESLIDCDSLPAEVHESNPNIPTFAKTLANVLRK